MPACNHIETVVRDRSSQMVVKDLEMRLRRHQITGTAAVAEATAKALRSVVSAAKCWRLEDLVMLIRTVGRRLQNALPSEPVIGNMTRRILFLLREEAKALTNLGESLPTGGRPQPHPSVAQSLAALSMSTPSSPATSMLLNTDSSVPPTPSRSFSISDLVAPSGAQTMRTTPMDMSPTSTPSTLSAQSPLHDSLHSEDGDTLSDEDEKSSNDSTPSHTYQLKPLLIQAIQELIDELESVDTSIAKDARDHIHSGEVILTLGHSSTVLSFLRAAAKHRKFIAVVPESAPSFAGHKMARALSGAGLSVLLVPDSNVYALMPRISKVILGARCVLANGGMLASIGAKSIAMAAREHSTPVVALAGVYKISPDWSWVSPERLTTGNQGPASQVVNYASSSILAGEADIENPLWDIVAPNDIDVIITNVGEHPPSYVYRLIQENYHEEDLHF
ncbi:nagb rpia transferase-like protein [Malassezia pachydermatis]|uniref:Translation initiation factor eIF2B subunit beta n=1 Tax=Malassezia pachydermatis TaxID=77020 RepID=A0A0M8MTW6_9BASI|nr:nagb rpia transferase-like protein [Malassezia pachydermatis]KOS14254.1 nagb rpia transferase-like protein [Malassezia pachydermatis]